MKNRYPVMLHASLLLALLLALSACQRNNNNTPTPGDSTPDDYPPQEAVYPPQTSDAAAVYPPGTETSPLGEISSTPPSPDVDLPPANAQTAVIGGVLIRELTSEGFVPLDPHELILGELVPNTEGTPTLIRYNENSLRAQTFPTGIFIFRDVPPGTYVLIVNLAVTEFPVRNPDGTEIFVTVEAGQVLDMGQVITQLP
ncbi:MAG: hypothetical protein L0332_04380 [Chloroflexi bacterium]|nr:hypothetical protein [Chloroflexota bacterium]MCI0580104.1 hypothetical protein [Chloroflexota bacterium]MCI0649320.1 hypothetical protein [Chloroflexota bacterium]MCI0725947.1 hypothetical protein [Chloroflexota bacterium]